MNEQPNGLWMGFPIFYTNTFDKYHPLFDFNLPHWTSGEKNHINNLFPNFWHLWILILNISPKIIYMRVFQTCIHWYYRLRHIFTNAYIIWQARILQMIMVVMLPPCVGSPSASSERSSRLNLHTAPPLHLDFLPFPKNLHRPLPAPWPL